MFALSNGIDTSRPGLQNKGQGLQVTVSFFRLPTQNISIPTDFISLIPFGRYTICHGYPENRIFEKSREKFNFIEMKKIILKTSLLLMASIFSFINNIEAQEITKFNDDNEAYVKLLEKTSLDVNDILLKAKPAEMSLDDYRANLIEGKMELAKEYQENVLKACTPLADYGYQLAKLNNIETSTDDMSTHLGYAAINARTFGFKIPDVTINESLTWGEVGTCALGAIGVSAGWAFSGSNATKWTISALTKAFSAAASKFLGPIGVGIAVATFAYCLLVESQDYQVPEPSDDPKDFKNIHLQIDPNLNFVLVEP